MTYKIYDITLKRETNLDLKNCTITGNNSLYEVKDGIIKHYDIINGKIDPKSEKEVSQIELTNYQIALFNALKGMDGVTERFDNNDLKNLTSERLQEKMNNIYKEKNVYEVIFADASKNSAELTIQKKGTNSDKNISIIFDKNNYFENLLSENKKYWSNLKQYGIDLSNVYKTKPNSANSPIKKENNNLYTIRDITTKKESQIELKNCTITGNTVAYKIKDGIIKEYKVIDGKIDKKSEKEVSTINLTNYQIALFNLLKNKDSNAEKLDDTDLKNITEESIQKELNAFYKEKGIYEALNAEKSKHNVELTIKHSESNTEKKIGIEFEHKGVFKQIWDGICSIGRFLKNMFNKSDSKNSTEKINTANNDKTIEKMNVNILPAYTYVAEGGEKPYILTHKLGVSLNRLKHANPNQNLDLPLTKGQAITVPKQYKVKEGSTHNFKDISKNINVSEKYIKNILIGLEGKNSKPKLKPYYDGVPDETHPKGYLTIGFGHTGRVFGEEMTSQNMDQIEITEAQAYEILAQDILDAKLDAMTYFGEDFEKAPQSVQDAIVDIMFNKGIAGFQKLGSPTCKIKNDLAKRDYVSAAEHTIYKTGCKGLQKRNVYRVAHAISSLTPNEQNEVRSRCHTYFENIKNKYNGAEKDSLIDVWYQQL